jgi:plasmid stability protein
MASMTIRNLDDGVKERLRVRAARNGRSMEEEARVILSNAVRGATGPEILALAEELFGGEKGVELDIPPRKKWRGPPDFSE